MNNWINRTSFGSEVDSDFKMLYDWAEAYHSGKSNQKKTDSEIYGHILDILDKYFEITKNLVGEIQNSERDNFALESELEEWLFFPAHHVVPSCEDSKVGKYHPLMLMNDIYQEEAERRLTRLKENSYLEYNIAKEILKSKVANRSKLVLRHGERDYKLKKDGSIKLFETYGSLTDIQEIRIIEKIESIQKRKNKKDVNVAYFGTLQKEELEVKYYFKNDGIILDDFKYNEDHFFNHKFGNIELNDINTLQILLEKYDLVLFLDESYFYKKYQSHKTAREDNRALYVDWYWSNAKRYQQDILAKMNMYFALYEEARRFLDDKVNVLSSNYEFDDRLFKRLEALSTKIGKNCADIYLYINYGKIADRSIENENVCKDEMYDGKSINVYKIGGGSASYSKTVQNSLSIDYWKMIKSISNHYYISYWKDYDIRTLKNNYLEIVGGKIKDNDKTELYVYYCYRFDDDNKKNNELINFTNAIFSIVKGSVGMDCVKNYVKNMLAESILSRADKVADILLAYWIPRKMNIIFEEKKSNNQRQGSQGLSYRKRKMIYNIIEKLDNLLLRDVDQLESTIYYDIKPSFAAEISDNDFYEYLKQINSACTEIGDNDSRLSLYSSRLILNTKKANNSAE